MWFKLIFKWKLHQLKSQKSVGDAIIMTVFNLENFSFAKISWKRWPSLVGDLTFNVCKSTS